MCKQILSLIASVYQIYLDYINDYLIVTCLVLLGYSANVTSSYSNHDKSWRGHQGLSKEDSYTFGLFGMN